MIEGLPYRCFIFDLDGTLIDSRRDIAAALNAGRSHFGLPEYELEQVMPMIGHGLKHLVECGFKDDNIDIKKALSFVEEAYQKVPCRYSTLFPGVEETLNVLQKEGYSLYIVSNKPSFLVPLVLQSLEIQHFFKSAFGGEEFPHKKPHPFAIEHILSLEPQLEKADCLMVGDMSPDIDMAKHAEIDSAFCTFGYAATPLEATHQITQFSDLLNIKTLC